MDLRRRFGSVPSGTHSMTHALRRRALLVSSALWLAPNAAAANPLSLAHLDRAMASYGAAGATLFAALAAITCAGALVHLASRRKWGARERQLVNDLTQTRADLDRSNSFLAAESQILVSWGHAGGEPDIAGDLSLAMEQPAPQRVLAFLLIPWPLLWRPLGFRRSALMASRLPMQRKTKQPFVAANWSWT